METIEERAKELATHRVYDNDGEHIYIDNAEMFLHIAVLTEQREIDIQRAVEWLKEIYIEKYLNTRCSGGYEHHELNNDFFNDFIQAMKGE